MRRRDFLRKTGAIASLPLIAACGTDGTDGADPSATTADGTGGADGGAGADAAKAPLPNYEYSGEKGPASLFSHGVASGDPLPSAVILWTRVSVPDAKSDTEVFWEIATDTGFEQRVGAGTFTTGAARDFTVKVDATDLTPGTTHYYRFWLQGRASPVGRTRTAPEGKVSHARFGVCSCSNYTRGLFLSYKALAARKDLDAVLHLGDYIYESGYSGGMRKHDPNHKAITLDDYRGRYRQYHTDPDLQAAHRQHPFICVWDDHESANNAFQNGAQGHAEDKGEGTWADRKSAAMKAWHEWLPVREQADGRIWRHHAWGDLADIFMLDTRLWARAEQTTGSKKDIITDPKRPFLGPDQEKWLHEGLTASKARWKVLGQQVMMGQLRVGTSLLNTDQWDGYSATRDRLFGHLRAKNIDGFVVLTGDIHSSWAINLTEDSGDAKRYDKATGKGALGVEFVTPGVTSTAQGLGNAELAKLAMQFNPHIRWSELTRRGYFVLDLTQEAVQADWYHFDAIDKPDIPQKLAASWRSVHGSGHLTKAANAAAEKVGAPDLVG
ncbi:MAG: alkaline phosphatase D family protein [Myxococcales bacterium]|nr:alkaline phosphatase D family protein [Myxococcales bacterium]